MAVIQYILGFILIIVTSFILYFKWVYGYWKRRNIPYIEPKIPMGNLEIPLFTKRSFDNVLDDICRDFKSKGNKFGGVYFLHTPQLLILDPDLIKQILVKDFQHFRNRGIFGDVETDPFSSNLLSLEDDKWKDMRAKLSPTYTSGKMKLMFHAILSCGDQLIDYISDLSSKRTPLDVNEVISCFGTDVIGSCAFGIECNSLKNPDAEFRRYGRQVTELTGIGAIRVFIAFVMPELNNILKMKIFSTDVTNFFFNAFKNVVDERNSNNIKRNDFVQLLMDMSASHGQTSTPLTLTEMAAQSFLFFLAGFGTTATNLTYCLYELALQPEIQQKLRDEIMEVLKKHNELTYDSLLDMKYMDQVIDETLRKYPSVALISRKCTKTYPIPGTDAIIKEGETIFINVRGLQRDEEYFPNPEVFNPDRFSTENKEKMKAYTHIPFGGGPRVCIGQRFAIMQIKIGLSLILRKFKVLPHETTPNPIKFSLRNVGSWLTDEPILLRTELL